MEGWEKVGRNVVERQQEEAVLELVRKQTSRKKQVVCIEEETVQRISVTGQEEEGRLMIDACAESLKTDVEHPPPLQVEGGASMMKTPGKGMVNWQGRWRNSQKG